MNVKFGGNNGTKTGVTTADYVEAIRIEGNGGLSGKTVIHITNLSGATTTMYYKVDGYLSTHGSCTSTAVTAETDITNATTVENTSADKPYAVIVISVKNHSGACNYQIDYMVY